MIRERPDRDGLQVQVDAGRDPLTGRKRYVSRQVPGKGRAGWKAAKQIEAELLTEVGAGRHKGSRSRTVGELLERWFAWRQTGCCTNPEIAPIGRFINALTRAFGKHVPSETALCNRLVRVKRSAPCRAPSPSKAPTVERANDRTRPTVRPTQTRPAPGRPPRSCAAPGRAAPTRS